MCGRVTLTGATLVAATLGCVSNPAPVPVGAGSPGLAGVEGRWEGEYIGAGRSGTIVFVLAAGGDSAFGEVVMVPPAGFQPAQPARVPDEEPARRERWRATPQVLRIQFVQVAQGHVSGKLAPYKDPECGCTLYTTFEGRAIGDTIEGTFTIRHKEGGEVQAGRWKVTRTRD